MLQPRLLASILITGLLRISPVASYNTSVNYITDGGAQYIYYPGKITGTFTHNTTRYDDPYKDFRDEVEYPCGDNGTYYWDLVKNLDVPPYMRIGVNAPWDTNPFFFSLHRGVDDRFRDDEEDDDDDLPHPPLPELEFTTAHFECLKDGALCGDLKLKPWEYVPLEEVDLWAATISQVKGEGGSAKGSFYAVAGDERSWVGDGRVLRNRARFQQPKNYSTTADCVKEVDIVWGKDTNFTYALNFTNTTASASFVVTVPEGVLSIFFEGAREDEHRDYGYSSEATPDPGDWREEYNPIALQVPAGSPLPKFTHTDGGGLVWNTDYQGRWYLMARSGSIASRGAGAAGMGIVAVAASLFLLI